MYVNASVVKARSNSRSFERPLQIKLQKWPTVRNFLCDIDGLHVTDVTTLQGTRIVSKNGTESVSGATKRTNMRPCVFNITQTQTWD